MLERLHQAGGSIGFGIATGRRLESALKILKEWNVPVPDVLVTAVGTEIYYNDCREPDAGYRHHLDYRWEPQALREVLKSLPGIRMQGAAEQPNITPLPLVTCASMLDSVRSGICTTPPPSVDGLRLSRYCRKLIIENEIRII